MAHPTTPSAAKSEIFPLLTINDDAIDICFGRTIDDIQRQSLEPQASDIMLGALNYALNEAVQQRPGFRQIIREFSGARLVGMEGGLSPSGAAGVIRSLVVAEVLKKSPTLQAPRQGYKSPDLWSRTLRKIEYNILHTDSLEKEISIIHLLVGSAKTSVARRGIPLELTLQTMQHRYPSGVDGLHMGSSIMELENQMLRKGEFPYSYTPVADTVTGKIDLELTQKVQLLLRRPSLINRLVCLDIDEVYINSRQAYSSAATDYVKSWLKPGELANPAFMRTFTELCTTKAEAIHFLDVDVTSRNSMKQLDSIYGNKKFDYVSLITILEELSPDQKLAALEEAKRRVKDNGFIFVQGHVEIDPSAESGFRTFPNWHDKNNPKYRSYVLDSHDHFTPSEVFLNGDSRINKLAPALGSIATRQGDFLSVSDALLTA